MTRQQINSRISDMTRQQIDVLAERRGLSIRGILEIAIDRLYREEIGKGERITGVQGSSDADDRRLQEDRDTAERN